MRIGDVTKAIELLSQEAREGAALPAIYVRSDGLAVVAARLSPEAWAKVRGIIEEDCFAESFGA